MDNPIERMAAAGAEQTWRDLCPVGDPAQAWVKCPPGAKERWRDVARAMVLAREPITKFDLGRWKAEIEKLRVERIDKWPPPPGYVGKLEAAAFGLLACLMNEVEAAQGS
jgi:hypothetical protein